MDRFGIYVHVPFCKKKCDYCDFISFSCIDSKKQDEYFQKLLNEIDSNVIENKVVTTIYFGGGTPSIVDTKYIEMVLNKIKEKYKLDQNCEITLEINPGTVNEDKLRKYKELGINRLSIGLQSTHDRLLKLIGRIHNFDEFLNTYNLARNIGFNNINVDLMLALPTQTEAELIDSVNKIIEINPEHISLYSLIVEEGTKLKENIDNNFYELCDENVERNMYWKTKEILEKNGYKQYEISNFSKKGFESKHNLDCWNQEEYIGYGLASHSYVNNERISNISDLDKYINNDFKDIKNVDEVQNFEGKAKEFMMIGLRKIEGVSISEFERRFKINPLFYFRFEISNLTEKNLIEVDLDDIKLTKKGLDFANIVFEEFI